MVKNGLERHWQLEALPVQRKNRLVVDDAQQDPCQARTTERFIAHSKLEKDATKGKQVRSSVHILAFGVLRRHIVRSPEDATGHRQVRRKLRFRNPEIGDPNVQGRGHQDVRGFDVTMHDIALVRVIQSAPELRYDLDGG